MQLAELLVELLGNQRLRVYLPPTLLGQFEQLMEAGLKRSGSLLQLHLAAGSTASTASSLYLSGTDEEDIVTCATELAEAAGMKAPTVRSVWYETCKLLTLLATRAVSSALHNKVPKRVKEPNLASGKADVMDMPLEILVLANEFLERESQAADEYAAVLLHCVAGLLEFEGYDEELLVPFSISVFRRLYNELIGSMALYILGVCPEDRLPRQYLQSCIEKREKEIARIDKSQIGE